MKVIELCFNALKTAEIDVYFPGNHKGECTSAYAVIKKLSSSQFVNYSTDIHYMEVLCCTPTISGCYELADRVKAVLGTLPAVKTTRNVSEPYYSENIKGWMVQLEYQYYKKI